MQCEFFDDDFDDDIDNNPVRRVVSRNPRRRGIALVNYPGGTDYIYSAIPECIFDEQNAHLRDRYFEAVIKTYKRIFLMRCIFYEPRYDYSTHPVQKCCMTNNPNINKLVGVMLEDCCIDNSKIKYELHDRPETVFKVKNIHLRDMYLKAVLKTWRKIYL